MVELNETECRVPGIHVHCNYCGEPFPSAPLGFKSASIHIRDEHPDVWNSDEKLREYADPEFGVR